MNEQKQNPVVTHAVDRILQMRLIEVNRVRIEAIIEQVVGESLQKLAKNTDYLKQQAEAWEGVFSTLNEVAPGWQHNGNSSGDDAAVITIRGLAQKASEPKADTSLRQQAGAWEAVCHTLDEVAPGWRDARSASGKELALAAIRKLASKAAKKKAKKHRSPQQIKLVHIDWNKAPGWATRVCATSVGCLLWANHAIYSTIESPLHRHAIGAPGEWKESDLEVICTRP